METAGVEPASRSSNTPASTLQNVIISTFIPLGSITYLRTWFKDLIRIILYQLIIKWNHYVNIIRLKCIYNLDKPKNKDAILNRIDLSC